MTIYNEQVHTIAAGIRAEAVEVQTILDQFRRFGADAESELTEAAIAAKKARVRELAAQYGYDLTEWDGEDAPGLDPDTVDIPA